MATMHGADVAQLRQLAAQFDAKAQALDANRMTVGNAIQVSAWVGPVAVRFRHTWESDYSRKLHDAASRLRDAATSLRANADDQERTSAVDAGGGGHPGSANNARIGTGSALTQKWDAMSDEEKRRLPLSQLTNVYGYAPSLPADVRDEANRIALERYLTQPCPAEPPQAVEDYKRHMLAYTQIKEALAAHPDAQLLVLDPEAGNSVHVAISLGDVDTADQVGVYTQGWTSRADKEGGLSGPVGEISALRDRVHSSLADAGRGDETTAMVVWMDYDAPQNQPSFGDLFGIANAQQSAYAEAGARNLTAFVDGIRANNRDASITGLGHSYGSYTTGLAAQETDAFDKVIVFGSPGVGATDASQLRVDGNFYVLEGGLDPIADSGQFGTDPSKLPGARNVPVERFGGHTDYLKDGGLSQRSIAELLVR
jgi:hypothetical protein